MLIFSVVCSLAAQQERGPSTAEERARFLDIVNKIQANPLDSSLKSDREWALLWLIQVPDVHASLCSDVLGPFFKSKYKYSSEIITVLTLASGRFSIEHPDGDKNAMYVAAVEGVLAAYDSILKQQPDAHSKPLDELVKQRTDGKLAEAVGNSAEKCKQ